MVQPCTHEWTLVTRVTEARSTTNCPLKRFCLPLLETLRYRHQKWINPRVRQSSTTMQLFTPIRARYLSPDMKINTFLIGDSLGATVSCYTFLESSRLVNVTPHLTCNAATYRFRDIRGRNWVFWGPLGVLSKGETVSGSHIYHRANFNADQCHRRRDIIL